MDHPLEPPRLPRTPPRPLTFFLSMRSLIRILATIAAPKARPARCIEYPTSTQVVPVTTTSTLDGRPGDAAYRNSDREKYNAREASTIPSESFSKKMSRLIWAVLAGFLAGDLLVFSADQIFQIFFSASMSSQVRTWLDILSSSVITGVLAWVFPISSVTTRDPASPSSPVNAPESR